MILFGIDVELTVKTNSLRTPRLKNRLNVKIRWSKDADAFGVKTRRLTFNLYDADAT